MSPTDLIHLGHMRPERRLRSSRHEACVSSGSSSAKTCRAESPPYRNGSVSRFRTFESHPTAESSRCAAAHSCQFEALIATPIFSMAT